MYRSIGARSSINWALILVAEAYLKLRCVPEGLRYLTEAEQLLATTDDRYGEAELCRVRRGLQTLSADAQAAAENYQVALTIARRQGAKIFELRAATPLARLWRDQWQVRPGEDTPDPNLSLVPGERVGRCQFPSGLQQPFARP